MTSLREWAWMRRLRQGDASAFDALHRAYAERVFRFAYRLSGSTQDAEDLTQDVFLAAFQGAARFEGRCSLATWLYRIALYRWRRVSADRDRVVALTDTPEPEAACADPAVGCISAAWLDSALAKLPEELFEAFVLVKAEGLKYREAAQALGVPQGTVQYRVHEATKRLRKQLGEEQNEGEGDAVHAS